MLHTNISQKMGSEMIRVGLVTKNDNNEVLLVKDEIGRIGKQIYNIPVVDVNKFEEQEIFNKFKDKYGIIINKLEGYINESDFLDDKCDKKVQVNMSCKICNNNIENGSWKMVDNILNEPKVPTCVKQSLEIYEYNSNIN